MKKQIVLATAAVLVSGSAFATKARMDALGQDLDGSWFIKDTRNAFYNPASVNGMKDYVVFESGDAVAADAENTPNAEGGFFKSSGDLTYGLYLGRTTRNLENYNNNGITGLLETARNNINGSVAAGTLQAAAAAQDAGDSLDLFVGGDMGVEWGARLTYANAKTEGTVERKRNTLGLALGMNMGDLSAQADLLLADKAEGITATDDTFEQDLGLDLAVDYRMGDSTFHIGYMKAGAENTVSGTLEVEASESILELGYARMMEVSSTSRWFYSAEYQMMKAEVTDKNGSTDTSETKGSQLPVTIGFESDATSWLTLRGSITQNVLIGSTENEFTGGGTANGQSAALVDLTTVRLGATLNFGKLMVDGVIGTGTGGATTTQAGRLNLDQVMTRVGVHYWF